jgi:hypothetical protein
MNHRVRAEAPAVDSMMKVLLAFAKQDNRFSFVETI